MADGLTIHVTGVDHVIRETRNAVGRLEQASLAGARTWAAQLENDMKRNAPWVDRTSNARNGLQAEAGIDADGVLVIARHTMAYGVFLELANGGQYGILRRQMTRNAGGLPRYVAIATHAAGF